MIVGGLIGAAAMGLVYSIGGSFWTALWLGILINVVVTVFTLPPYRGRR